MCVYIYITIINLHITIYAIVGYFSFDVIHLPCNNAIHNFHYHLVAQNVRVYVGMCVCVCLYIYIYIYI